MGRVDPREDNKNLMLVTDWRKAALNLRRHDPHLSGSQAEGRTGAGPGKSAFAGLGLNTPFSLGLIGQSSLILPRVQIRLRGFFKPKSLVQNMNERWLSVAEIASHLGVNPDTIYKWIERKQLPAHKVGRLWKFMATEVDEWVRAGKAAGDDRNE